MTSDQKRWHSDGDRITEVRVNKSGKQPDLLPCLLFLFMNYGNLAFFYKKIVKYIVTGYINGKFY